MFLPTQTPDGPLTKGATSKRTSDDFGILCIGVLEETADDGRAALEAEQPSIHEATKLFVGCVGSSTNAMILDMVPNQFVGIQFGRVRRKEEQPDPILLSVGIL